MLIFSSTLFSVQPTPRGRSALTPFLEGCLDQILCVVLFRTSAEDDDFQREDAGMCELNDFI